jgi:hypothetical protein
MYFIIYFANSIDTTKKYSIKKTNIYFINMISIIIKTPTLTPSSHITTSPISYFLLSNSPLISNIF